MMDKLLKAITVLLIAMLQVTNPNFGCNASTIEEKGNDSFEGTLPIDIKSLPMTPEHKRFLKEEAKEMFYHAYNSYMDNAYPADELMPLSCKGRWRDAEFSRGDIDDTLGNFSLTLVDSLDTLVILGDLEEFEHALKLIIKDVSFDHDIVVSLFETNIRMVGGLLSGHILSEHLNQVYGAVSWYKGELLTMAQDLATRLLPAFNTSTGIPHSKVNLKYGMKSPKFANSRDTCTACAGTIILEFACLSRLTGEPIFEEKARQAMDYLWSHRHRGSDLMGTILNVHSGDWVRRDAGVGAGIDSYYEYLLKAYVLLGDEGYLDRFNKHYIAVMKYVSQGPMLLDVHMHRPHTTSRNFMDALLAFWPGLQVLKGDIKPAIETHEMLYQVMQRHNFLPEAFTTDFQVHWGQHPLRPEFIESTYLLYEATKDSYYLNVGKEILQSLQKHAWVPCGYAAVKDVRTGVHEDRMDSFVLAETFKYLYLLFAEPADLLVNLEEFIFTTEAHLLPLSLARLSNLTAVPLSENVEASPPDEEVEYARSCPNAHYLFPGRNKYAETIRKPLKNFVNNICPSRKAVKRKLRASEFQAGNLAHMILLKDMGITIMALPDGRVQLLHTSSNSRSSEDAEEGLLFMQEMIELSKLQQDQPDNPPRAVTFFKPNNGSLPEGTKETMSLLAGPAQFGLELHKNVMVTGIVVKANPLRACGVLENASEVKDRIVIMERGDCMFIDKARNIEALGAAGGIVLDSTVGSSSASSPMFAMSGDGTDNVSIPLVFLFRADAQELLDAMEINPDLDVVLSDYSHQDSKQAAHVKSRDMDDIVIQAMGPTIKSTFQKQQQTQEDMTCTENIASGEDATQIASEEKKLSVGEALNILDKAESAEEVLESTLNYIRALQHEMKTKGDVSLMSTSVLSEVQILLLKKSAQNPNLLQTLLTRYLKELVQILHTASPHNKDLEAAVQLLVAKLSSISPSLPPTGDFVDKKEEANELKDIRDYSQKLLKTINDLKQQIEERDKSSFFVSEQDKLELLSSKLEEITKNKINKVKEEL